MIKDCLERHRIRVTATTNSVYLVLLDFFFIITEIYNEPRFIRKNMSP